MDTKLTKSVCMDMYQVRPRKHGASDKNGNARMQAFTYACMHACVHTLVASEHTPILAHTRDHACTCARQHACPA
eukprot:352159-Chlamydomonas_euryale.AAC.18